MEWHEKENFDQLFFFHSEPVQKYYVFASFGKSQVSDIIYNLRVHNGQQQYWEIDRKQKTVNNCYIAIAILL